VAFALSALATLAAAAPPREPHTFEPLPADLGSGELFDARLALELRRAGGARRDTLARLFAMGRTIPGLPWRSRALRACRERLVSCSEPGFAGRAFQDEAILQGLARDDLHGLLLRALTGIPDPEDEVKLLPWMAAYRAVSEGFFDLLPHVEAVRATAPAENRHDLGNRITLAQASRGAEPLGALLRIVERAAGLDVALRSAVLDGAKPVPRRTTQPHRVGHFALDRIRRLGKREAIEPLGRTLRRYEALRSKAPPGAKPDRILGRLGWEIAETIGDLGDRDFERAALGRRTLWDRVKEAEDELVRRGSLPESELVTR